MWDSTSLSSTCPDSTSPGGRRLAIVTPMSRISRGEAGSRLPASPRRNQWRSRAVRLYERSAAPEQPISPTATANCGGAGSVWFPDLRRSEVKVSVGVMVKF